MQLAEIWRYPVKSMAGEKLQHAMLDELGIAGDRIVHVQNNRGRVITSRTHPKLLGHKARLNASGMPLVDERPWNSASVAEDIKKEIGASARLVHYEGEERFDILPLLVATDGAIAAFGYDGRRLRPNLIIGGVEGLAERTWPGKILRINSVLIGVQDLRGRCVMTTFDPDTLVQDREVLASIVARFEGTLALNCFVIQGGEVRVGDAVELLEQE